MTPRIATGVASSTGPIAGERTAPAVSPETCRRPSIARKQMTLSGHATGSPPTREPTWRCRARRRRRRRRTPPRDLRESATVATPPSRGRGIRRWVSMISSACDAPTRSAPVARFRPGPSTTSSASNPRRTSTRRRQRRSVRGARASSWRSKTSAPVGTDGRRSCKCHTRHWRSSSHATIASAPLLVPTRPRARAPPTVAPRSRTRAQRHVGEADDPRRVTLVSPGRSLRAAYSAHAPGAATRGKSSPSHALRALDPAPVDDGRAGAEIRRDHASTSPGHPLASVHARRASNDRHGIERGFPPHRARPRQ